jgi:hypothetical protein
MLYEKNLMDKWDAYSVLKTAEEKSREKGAEQKSYELVKNLLSHTSFGIARIAALANVTEDFVKKVREGRIK